MNLKSILILAGLIILLAGAVFYFLKIASGEKEEKRPQIWSVADDKIKRISIDLPGKKLFVAFFKDKEEKWRFEDKAKQVVDIKRWGGIVSLVSGPKAKRLITESPEDLTQYGLNNPPMVVTLGLQDQKNPLVILFGGLTPQGDQYYVKIKDQPTVYIMHKEYCEVLMRLAQEPPHPPAVKSIETKKD